MNIFDFRRRLVDDYGGYTRGFLQVREPRLVYADWLEKHGDADRAEFMRGQFRLAGMNPWAEGYTELDLRCRELTRRHPDWLGWLAPFAERGAQFFGWERSPFRRGFPAQVTLRPDELVAHHDRLFTAAPIRL
jgi:hypothetical protein